MLPVAGWFWCGMSGLRAMVPVGLAVAGIGLVWPRGVKPLFLTLSLVGFPIGLVAGLVTEYCCWSFWIFALSNQQVLTFDPLALFAIGEKLLPVGTWGLKSGGNVTGLPLAGVWLAEAGIILYFSVKVCLAGLRGYLCCPRCETWFKKPTRVFNFAIPETLEQITERLSKLDFTCLAELTEIEHSSCDKFLSLEFYRCPKCVTFDVFTLKSVEVWQEKKEVKSRHVILIDRRIIPEDHVSGLSLDRNPPRQAS